MADDDTFVLICILCMYVQCNVLNASAYCKVGC